MFYGYHFECILFLVRAEELANCKELISLKLSGTKLDKKDTFGKSDPFLVISRVNTDDRYVIYVCAYIQTKAITYH